MSAPPPSSSEEAARLLSIYLNDHYAGSTGGVALARRVAAHHRGAPEALELGRLVTEIEEDRATLLDLMQRVGARRDPVKAVTALVGERLGRLTPNGYLVRRSPLSSLVELEALQLGVTGKAAAWRALRALTDSHAGFDADAIDRLVARAEDQRERIEAIRLTAVRRALTPPR